jgi:hypothetical protein
MDISTTQNRRDINELKDEAKEGGRARKSSEF